MKIHHWFPQCRCEECEEGREHRRRAARHIRFTFKTDAFSFTGDNLIMSNTNPNTHLAFTLSGTDAGLALDVSKATVKSSDPKVATVDFTPAADGKSGSGVIHYVAVGACSIDADDLLANGQDIKASLGVNVVLPATLAFTTDPAGAQPGL